MCFGAITHEFPEPLGTLGERGQGLANSAHLSQRSFEEKGIAPQAGLKASLAKSEQNSVRRAGFLVSLEGGPHFPGPYSFSVVSKSRLSGGSLMPHLTPATA